MALSAGSSVQGIDRVNILYCAYKQLEQLAPAQIVANKEVFNAVVVGEASQLALIGAVEQHFGVEKVALAKAVALLLKTFYDEDIITEDVLISWYDGPKSEFSPSSVDDEALAFVKGKAEVFINWMKEASSDDSDDSDSDDSDSDDSD